MCHWPANNDRSSSAIKQGLKCGPAGFGDLGRALGAGSKAE